jgi:hypothetical protein
MVSRRALDRIYEKVLAGEGTIAYRDFEALLEALGFTRKGQKAATGFTFIQLSVGRFPCNRMVRTQSGTKSGSFAR